MPDIRTEAIAQISELVDDVAPRIQADGGRLPFFKGSYVEARTLRTRMVAATNRLAAPHSAYRDQVQECEGENTTDRHKVATLTGILIALRDDYEAGYLQSVQELIHADVFGDFLEMAQELLDKNYKDPAAVVAGSVLEEHLRKLAGLAGVSVSAPDGKPVKADRLNADLTKAGVYTGLEQKSVTAWLGLRNHAAHGEYDKYDAAQVANLLSDIRAFLIRHPA